LVITGWISFGCHALLRSVLITPPVLRTYARCADRTSLWLR
jgi:hypothetical protein